MSCASDENFCLTCLLRFVSHDPVATHLAGRQSYQSYPALLWLMSLGKADESRWLWGPQAEWICLPVLCGGSNKHGVPRNALPIIAYPLMLASSRYYFLDLPSWRQWQPESHVKATMLLFSLQKKLRSVSKTHPARAQQNASTATMAGVCLVCSRAARSIEWTQSAWVW